MLGGLAAALRLPRALSTSFWQDEVASARILREPGFAAMLRHVVRTESTPPLWYALAWAMHRVGVPIHDVRLLSVAANGLLVAAVVVLARRVLPRWYALLAGLLVAVGGEFSAQGRWIRAYELFALLAVVFALALVGAVERPTRLRIAGLAAVTAAGALTHYFFLFTIAAAVAWLLVEPAARGTRRRVGAALGAGLVPLVAWLPELRTQIGNHRYSWIGPFDLHQVLETPLRLFTPLTRGGVALAVSAALLAACVAGASALWRQGSAGRLVVSLAALPLALAAVTWATGHRIYADRNMIAIGPFVAVAAGAALHGLPRHARHPAAILVAAALVGGFAWDQTLPTVSYSSVASALVAEGWHPGDPIAVPGDPRAFASPLAWYLPGAGRGARTTRSRRAAVFVISNTRLPHHLSARQVDGLVVNRLATGTSVARPGSSRLTLLDVPPRPAARRS